MTINLFIYGISSNHYTIVTHIVFISQTLLESLLCTTSDLYMDTLILMGICMCAPGISFFLSFILDGPQFAEPCFWRLSQYVSTIELDIFFPPNLPFFPCHLGPIITLYCFLYVFHGYILYILSFWGSGINPRNASRFFRCIYIFNIWCNVYHVILSFNGPTIWSNIGHILPYTI